MICVNKYAHIAVGKCILKYFHYTLHVHTQHVTCSKKKSEIKKQVVKSWNPVLSMSGCTLYSLAKTKGTIPWGRAACKNNTKWSKSQNRLHRYGYPKRENTCYLDLCMKDILVISLYTRACKLRNLHCKHSKVPYFMQTRHIFQRRWSDSASDTHSVYWNLRYVRGLLASCIYLKWS